MKKNIKGCKGEGVMAKYCTQCGTPLKDGEICQCQRKAAQNNQKINYQQNTYKQSTTKQNVNRNPYPQPEMEDSVTISTEDWVPIKKLIGIGESNGSDVQGCFERNKKIVPDLIAPCEQEIPVKQYHICNARSRIRGLWQEGRIQVTNKRVLFRLSGRSWIGKAMDHTEFTIDEVAGVSLSNGVRFGIWDFLVGAFICFFAVGLGSALGQMPAFLSYVLALAITAAACIFLKKKYFIKALCQAVSLGMLGSSAMKLVWQHEFWSKFGMFLAFVIMILFIISLFLFALKPSLSISVTTKCASAEPIYIWSRQTMVSIMEILPGEDADVAIEELGSMIMDIQKLGDYGIKKWKED